MKIYLLIKIKFLNIYYYSNYYMIVYLNFNNHLLKINHYKKYSIDLKFINFLNFNMEIKKISKIQNIYI